MRFPETETPLKKPGGLMRLADPLSAALIVMGFLSGWVRPAGHSLPLFLAVILAARAYVGDRALFVGALSLLGLLASGSGSAPVPSVLAVVLSYPLYGLLKRTGLPLDVRLAAAAALLSLLSGAVWLAPLAAAEGALPVLALLFLLRGLAHMIRHGSPGLRDGATAALFLLLVAGTRGIALGGASLPAGVAALGVLLATEARSEGAALAPLAGLVMVLQQEGHPAVVGALSLGAALAVLGRSFGRWAQALGFLAGETLLSLVVGPGPTLANGAGMGLGAAVLFLLLPERLWARRRPLIALRDVSGPEVKLAQVSLALREMASALTDAGAAGRSDPSPLITSLIEHRTCRGCPHLPTCWEERAAHTHLGFRHALSVHRPGTPFTEEEIPAEVRRRCPRPGEVALAATFALEMEAREDVWRARMGAVSRLLGAEIRQAAGLIDLALVPSADEEDDVPGYAFRAGMARVPKGGGGLSGDAVTVREIPQGRLLLALSDGMGVGVKAFKEANLTLDLVERLLVLGVPTPELVDMVNAFLLLRSPGDAFATLDMAVLDLRTGEGEIVKVGSPPSFLIKDNEVERLQARSVPVGILEEVSPQIFSTRMQPGDMLLFLSDGMVEAGAEWVDIYLRTNGAQDPQALADALLDRALKSAHGEARDDMTVLCAAILPVEPRDTGQIHALLRRSLARSRIGHVPVGKAGRGGGHLPHGR